MKIAFYKGYGHTIAQRVVTALINLWTWGKYSHVELVDTLGETNPEEWHWYSASAFKEGEVRVKKMVPFNPDNWDIWDIETETDECKSTAFNVFCEESGKKYDWVGIFLSMIIPLKRHQSNKWFCSEITRFALCHAKIVPCDGDHHHYSPNALYRELKKARVING